MRCTVFLTLLVAATPADAGQTQASANPAPTAQSTERVAQAYEQFLLARRLEDADDAEAAAAAYRQAMTLDPDAAEIPASLADLYVRLNRADEAIAAAERALKIDSTNREAHRVLGTIYGSRATSGGREARAERRQNLDRAIEHLEQAVVRPVGGPRPDVNLRAMLARLYYGAAAYDKAIPLLAELVKEEPGWQDGASLLVEAYAAAGRGDEAITWLEQAALNNPQLYATLADFYGRAHRWSDAAAAYDRALADSPRSIDIRVRYASALLNAGGASEIAGALEVLKGAAELRPSDERVLYLLSQAQRRAGDLEGAEATARRLIATNEGNPRAYALLAEALEERRRYAAVVEALAPAVARFRTQKDPTFPLALLLPHLGFAYQQTGDLPRAITSFADALTLSPRDPVLTGYLVQAHVAAGNYAEALEITREARAAQPDDLGLARLEAHALSSSGKPDQAVSLLEAILKKQSEDPEAHLALARAYGEAGRGEQAVKLLQDAEARFPDQTRVTFELGATLERQQRYAEAETAFRRVIASDPNHSAALNYLGYMFADRGENLTESIELIKRALVIEPDNGSYLDSLGWAYFKGGQLNLAEEHLRRAADQLTGNSVVQDHFGDVLFQLGRLREAIDAWNLALTGDGDDIDRDEIDRKIRSAERQLPR